MERVNEKKGYNGGKRAEKCQSPIKLQNAHNRTQKWISISIWLRGFFVALETVVNG